MYEVKINENKTNWLMNCPHGVWSWFAVMYEPDTSLLS